MLIRRCTGSQSDGWSSDEKQTAVKRGLQDDMSAHRPGSPRVDDAVSHSQSKHGLTSVKGFGVKEGRPTNNLDILSIRQCYMLELMQKKCVFAAFLQPSLNKTIC